MATPSQLVGQTIAHYRILERLGAGGMGEVYRAHDLLLRRDVAVKVLPALSSSDPDRLRRFEQEAMAAAALNHPNILAVFDMGKHEGVPYLVSELLEGETLREYLRRGRLSQRKVVEYAVQVARGLSAAHDKGIVHRDLKPENLFVMKDGRVKILDFGLVKLVRPEPSLAHNASTLASETEPGVVMGTVGYMSPEQVRGKSADHRTDIFAFGAILFEMLVGTRAFHKPTSAETMSAILNEDPPGISHIAPSLSPALQRVVHRCLEKSPEQRFQSASDLAFALEALSESGNAAAITVPARSRVKWAWISVMAVAIAIAAGLVARWRTPPAVPEVVGVVQLTDDAEPKQGRLVTDGSRIYFNEGETGSWRIAQVSVTGGQTAPVPTRLENPQIVGLMPDTSALLAMVAGFMGPVYPLWRVPLPAGEPRRIGDIEASDANFFPDGRIVFTQGTGLFIAEKNGSNPKKILDTNRARIPFAPSVSPDGSRVEVTLCYNGAPPCSLEEIAVESSRSQELLKPDIDAKPCCSTWTPDGKYLLFQSLRNGRSDLWAFPEQAGLFKRVQGPIRLTNGPLSYSDAVVSDDGKHIFAIGSKPRGELVRYDAKNHEYVPYLSGMSATEVTFSQDGNWVAYRSYPDYSLWRSRIDGTDRLQLSYPPTVVFIPVISHDGKNVSYGTADNDLFVVSTAGGAPRKIAQQCIFGLWSPDDKMLAATCMTRSGPGVQSLELRIADLESGSISVVPESHGKCCAFWVAQSTLVAATEDTTKFLTFDFRTQKWSELASGVFVNWFISPDRKFLYYTTGGADPKALRIRFSDRKVETITNLKGLHRIVDYFGHTQINVAPDGSPLFTRDIGTQEIYALDVKWP